MNKKILLFSLLVGTIVAIYISVAPLNHPDTTEEINYPRGDEILTQYDFVNWSFEDKKDLFRLMQDIKLGRLSNFTGVSDIVLEAYIDILEDKYPTKKLCNLTSTEADPWWNNSWKYRRQISPNEGIFYTPNCTEEQITQFIENNYSYCDYFDGCYIKWMDVAEARSIISNFSIQGYSIKIPLKNLCVNCSDLVLTMGGEAYPCYHYDSPPFRMWEAPPCIIFDNDVWVKMDLRENESWLIYFYYGEASKPRKE